MQKVVKLKPFINEKIWGGDKLQALKNIKSKAPVGETWEVSSHKDGPSMLDDKPLSNMFDLNYLVKFIDTSDNLSIQVHPGDEYAQMHENSSGKTECWLILDAADGAGIYLGFKAGITRKEFFNAVSSGLHVEQFLNFIPVRKGDFFHLPAGTVHAIGKDVTLCEVQQSSGITYRVWDWNRKGLDGKPRQLHIEKAKDVLNFNEDFNQNVIEMSKMNTMAETSVKTLIEHPQFKVELFSHYKKDNIELTLLEHSSIIVLEGAVEDLNAFESGFIIEPGQYHLSTQPDSSFLVVTP